MLDITLTMTKTGETFRLSPSPRFANDAASYMKERGWTRDGDEWITANEDEARKLDGTLNWGVKASLIVHYRGLEKGEPA